MTTHDITTTFLWIIGGILVAGIYLRLVKKKTNKVITLLPSLAASLGILGTFVGIYLGLLEFNVSNINDSIPKLLEGLKTAFATSIAGLIVSLILKFIFEGKTTQEESKNDVQQDDPVELLKLIVIGINSLEKSSKEIESSIVSCFRSDEEYSLISQLKLIRQEVVDTRKEVSESFRTFADKIAESSTDALVKALEKVIGDFNTLLNELVSESFKELSAAMIKLTEWQENYKTHIDETQGKIDTLLDHMKQTVTVLDNASNRILEINKHLGDIDSSLGGISVSAEDISAHVENLTRQNEILQESISAIKQIGEDAKSVVPVITENINQLTTKLETTVQNVTEKFDSNSSKIEEFVTKSIEDIQNAVDSHSEKIQDSIESIDKGLEEELSKALNSLAGSLASLSGKFVEDYQPLTERLREVVRLAERTNA